ncbi:MAG: ATP-binding protein [Woeseiaceae bacterium]|nr:ATP-binding protein [Woeseiaceae bacterium]
MEVHRILVAGAAGGLGNTVAEDLQAAGYAIVQADSDAALDILAAGSRIDLVVECRRTGRDWSLLRTLRRCYAGIPVIVVLDDDSSDQCHAAAREGAVRVLTRHPKFTANLRVAIAEVLEARRGAGRRPIAPDGEGGPAQEDGRDRLVHAVEQASEMILVTDATGVVQYANAAIEQKIRQAQRMEAIGQLAGGVAQEFNNLLTAIRGHCDNLDAQFDDSSLRREVAEINRAAERAAQLTRDLMSVARLHVLQAGDLDVGRVLGDMRELLRSALGPRIDLRFDLASDPGVVYADRARLEQVLINIIVNARQAMPQGGTLTIRTYIETFESSPRPAQLRAARYVAIEVTDTGRGIDSDTLPRVFDPFYTTRDGGAGLGLSTAWGIVRQSGGLLTVHSTPGDGATFTAYLPFAEGREEAAAASAPPVADDSPGARILLVEDSEQVRRLSGTALSRAGHALTVAASAEEALDIAAGQGTAFDLVITDVVLPGLSGPDLVERLERDGRCRSVVFMSGYARELLVGGRGAGPGRRFLAKPFSLDELRTTVAAALRDGAGPSAPDPATGDGREQDVGKNPTARRQSSDAARTRSAQQNPCAADGG